MKISTKRKLKEGRGKGEGKQYKPLIKTREINSAGTCSNFVDWKTGRQMELLSQTELYIYMQFRWQDDVVDINEQYPIDWFELNRLIDEINIQFKSQGLPAIKRHYSEQKSLTTDLIVIRTSGVNLAVSVKYNKKDLSPKEIETVWLEKQYWNRQGYEFRLMDRSDVNEILVKNLRLVTEYYDRNRVYDEDSLIKHLIATKKIDFPLDTQLIDMTVVKQLLKGDMHAKLSVKDW